MKCADDTTVVGLVSGGDKSAYRDEMQRLSAWCSVNNWVLNTTKTKDCGLQVSESEDSLWYKSQKITEEGGESGREGYQLPAATTGVHCCCTTPYKS